MLQIFLLNINCFYFRIINTDTIGWLRHCATNWKVAGPIHDGVIGIFH